MRYPSGNFSAAGDKVQLADLKPGEFGYIVPQAIAAAGKQAYINLDVEVHRNALYQCVRVQVLADDCCQLEFVGFDRHTWPTIVPAEGALLVKTIEARPHGISRTYESWSGMVICVTVGRMPVGSTYYAYYADTETWRGRRRILSDTELRDEPYAGVLPVRRLTECHYELEVRPGVWDPLPVVRR